uniref:Ras and Rab interactor 2-like n=1 Tax=Gouania willdenowi TaxID=441366 RepID=A0A8C5EQY6_GOUWI
MPASIINQSCKQERMGSFFKLIESFALEIGSLRKEMGKKTESEEDNGKTDHLELSEEVGGLFLRSSPCAGTGAELARVRDSGYHSLHRRLSILDRLVHTHAVWLQLGLSHQEAARILTNQPMGTFVVRRSNSLKKKVVSLRMHNDSPVCVKDFPVKESQYTFSLEGSGLSFADLFRLVAFCSISRDVLPFTLKLPEAISSAETFAQLQEVAKLGAGFWDADWNERKKRFSLLTTPHISLPPSLSQRPVSLTAVPGCPQFQTRTPAEIDCYQSNGALCFINPLFIKVHQLDGTFLTATLHNPGTPKQGVREEIRDLDTGNTEAQRSCLESPPANCSDQNQETHFIAVSKLVLQDDNSSSENYRTHSEQVVPRSPPPRPPPPNFAPQRSVSPLQQQSMPEKIPLINSFKEDLKEKEKGGGLLSWLGSSFSISTSSSPPKRVGISYPISIPSLALPRSSLSHSPYKSKTSPSNLDDAQCHLAMEDQTIEKALNRAKLHGQNVTQTSSITTRKPEDLAVGQENDRKELRLSDISTDSSGSLDFSQLPSIFNSPPDPSPPTVTDHDKLPKSPLSYDMDMEGEEDDGEEEEEEPDNDVSFESDPDQDQDVTMVPPTHRTKRRSSASALVLRKALQGQLRKMSGVFNSLMTPEKRAIRRVLELSQNKASYFGCLVHDFISYMSEGSGTQAWQVYTSGLELLQSVRQFMTQMKIYLRQSSEMELPIESLISEDQIDQVLEKAMQKCVLKPLRQVVNTALQEFQLRSGTWQQLKDNLSLAKARQPQEMGVSAALHPDPVAIEKIKLKFQVICKMYSPEKKVIRLLRICKCIYNIMQNNSGRMYGADDFLPMLTYVLAQCDMPQLDNEILYMMELLDPSQHNGEGGYYLISAYGAMTLIKNFQEEQAARVLSSETKDTLRQWHSQWQRRRHTTQCCAPSIDDFQSYLRVVLQDLSNGCTAKTLQTEGSSQQLAADTYPQKIKAELHSRPQSAPFYFVFRRVDSGSTITSINDLSVTLDPQGNPNNASEHP